MLVLLNRPEDIESHLPELTEIAKMQGIATVYLAKVSRAFRSRSRSIAAPHKLDMATRMGDAAAGKYFSKIVDDLRTEGVDIEPISPGIPAMELDKFIEIEDIDLIVTTDGRSELCQWHVRGFTKIQGRLLCERVFEFMPSTP